MLQFLFFKLLILSASFTFALLVLTAVFWIFKKTLSAKQKYRLLLIPLLLCLIPVNFGMGTDGMNLVSKQADLQITKPQQGAQTAAKQARQSALPQQMQTAAPEIQQEIITPGKNTMTVSITIEMIKNSLVYLWMLGAAALFFYKASQVIQFKRNLKQIAAPPPRDIQIAFNRLNPYKRAGLKCFDGVSTPFITGIFRPMIYMPKMSMAEWELCMVLEHELIHIKRRDMLVKRLMDFISVIHFFNPFVYLLQNKLNSYCELSCDEEVTRNMDLEQRRDYGKMLLALMKQRNQFLDPALCLLESEKNMKERLEIIMKRNKIRKFSITISVALACTLTFGSVVFAGTVGGIDNSKLPKESYQGEMNYISFGEKSYVYELNARLDTRTPEQMEKNRMTFSAMDKSRQTRKVNLGEIVKIVDNGKQVDPSALNSRRFL